MGASLIVPKAGIYRMPPEQYHRDPAPGPSLSSSLAKTLIQKSPLHAWTEHPRLNPKHESEERAMFDRGSACHALLLEGENRMQVIHADNYMTKAAKELRDKARREGKHPVLAKVFDDVMRMQEQALITIRNSPDLGGLTLKDGVAEDTFLWQKGGVWYRCRPDWHHRRRIFLDYKTTDASASPSDWVRTMSNLGGDIQGAFYLWGNEETPDEEFPDGPGHSIDPKFIFLVQEASKPFACSLVGLGRQFIELGRWKVNVAAELWARCVETQSWPSYPPRIAWVSPPSYYAAKWEEREGEIEDSAPARPAFGLRGSVQEDDPVFP